MKKILLLGGFGFIGSNVLRFIDHFYSDVYEVIVFDKTVKHPFGHEFKCVSQVYAGDFSDPTVVRTILRNHAIDYVFHFISSTVPATSGNHRYDIESNLIPTVEFLECLVSAGVKNVVYLSSGGAIYGNSKEKHSETDNNFPISSYGIVKLSIEKYLLMFKERFDLHPLILRLSNPYGPLHYSMKQGVVNVAVRDALEKKEFTIWGTGEGKKDYIFITDVVDILFKLIEQGIHDEIINIGSGDEKSVNEITGLIKTVLPGFVWKFKDTESFDVSDVTLNLEKLLNILGGYSFTPFHDGLEKTIEWLRGDMNSPVFRLASLKQGMNQ